MGKKAQQRRQKNEEAAVTQKAAVSAVPDRLIKAKALLPALLIACILLTGIVLRFGSISVEGRSPDEGIYTMQAKAVARDGMAGLKRVVADYNAVPKAWIYPPPTRTGYIFLVGAVMKVSGVSDFRAGIYTSAVFSVLAMFVVLAVGLRFFNGWITAAALLFMAFSPMELAIARRSWQDGVLAFFSLLLIYVCCELTVAPKRKALYLPFVFLGTYCVLIKESGILICGLCLAWMLWVLVVRERALADAAILLGGMFVGACIGISVLAGTVGGLGALLEVWGHVKEAMPTNTYAIDYQTGPWYRLLEGLWILVPAYMLFAVGGMISACIQKELRKPDRSILLGMGFVTAAFIAVTILTPYCQNVRYISAVYGAFYLMGGFGVWSAATLAISNFGKIGRYVAVTIIALLLIGVAISEYRTFKHIFLDRGIRDISVRLLRESV